MGNWIENKFFIHIFVWLLENINIDNACLSLPITDSMDAFTAVRPSMVAEIRVSAVGRP